MIYDQITTTPTIYDSRFTIRSPVTPTTTYDHDHDYDSRFSFQWKHPKRKLPLFKTTLYLFLNDFHSRREQ